MSNAAVVPSVEPPATTPTDDEVLQWALDYVRHAPVSLALREINRLIALRSVDSSRGPVLDVGCGDGFWWSVRPDERDRGPALGPVAAVRSLEVVVAEKAWRSASIVSIRV